MPASRRAPCFGSLLLTGLDRGRPRLVRIQGDGGRG